MGNLLGELVLVWGPPRGRSGAVVRAQGSPRGGQRGARRLRNRPAEHREAAEKCNAGKMELKAAQGAGAGR